MSETLDPSVNAIIVVDDIKQYLNLTELDIQNNDFFQDMINKISSAIESKYDQKVASQVITEITNGNGRSRIRPRYYPILQISSAEDPTESDVLSSIQFRDDVASGWEDIETDQDYVEINTPIRSFESENNSHTIELTRSSFPYGQKNIKLIYKAGLSTSYLEAVKLIVIEMVILRYKESRVSKSAQLGMSSFSTGFAGQSGTLVLKDLKPSWEKELDQLLKRKY